MLLYTRVMLSEIGRELALTVVLAIDIYYRLEWFDMHTEATMFLHPFFGGE